MTEKHNRLRCLGRSQRSVLFFVGLLFCLPLAAQEQERAHFHHVHLNVTDVDHSIEFYTRVFGAVPIKFRNMADAVFTERSFILFNKVAQPAPGSQESAIWHLGWGGIDVPAESKWYKSQGVEVHTELYPLGRGYVTYWNDPDKVMIEVNTMGHKRFAHIHLLAEDVNGTAAWYAQHLGLQAATPRPFPVGDKAEFKTWGDFYAKNRAWSNRVQIDNVTINVYNMPNHLPAPPWWPFEPLMEFKPQRGRAIDHFAVSYRNLDAAFARMQNEGVTIVEPITLKKEFNLRSFFVLGPDNVTIEVVEAKPIPEGLWD